MGSKRATANDKTTLVFFKVFMFGVTNSQV